MPHDNNTPTWNVNFPGAIQVEAAKYGYGSSKNTPKAWCLHSPEEAPDDYPATPYYFHNLTDRNASTHYFVSYLGFVFQMVPETEGAYANVRETGSRFSWEDTTNLNLQTLNVEIEGYAHNIHETMPRGSPQWVSLIRLLAHRCQELGFPIERTFGHKQVSPNRSDPGQLNLQWIVWDVNELLGVHNSGEEDNMPATDTPGDWLGDGTTRTLSQALTRIINRVEQVADSVERVHKELDDKIKDIQTQQGDGSHFHND